MFPQQFMVIKSYASVSDISFYSYTANGNQYMKVQYPDLA